MRIITSMLGLVVVVATLSGSSVGFNQPFPSQSPAVATNPKLQKVYEILYPYYQKPRYRYPFYDLEGNGELLYGYGGPKLYRYTIFKPVEGYMRRR